MPAAGRVESMALPWKAALAAGALVLVAGCFELYESGTETPIECEPTTDPSQLDDGVPNPLRCERTDDNQTDGLQDDEDENDTDDV